MTDRLGERISEARPRLMAALAHQFRDIDLAEEALASAIEAAFASGEELNDPAAWLYVSARRKALDIRRRQQTEARTLAADALVEPMSQIIELPDPIPDERLRLLFVCCHPSLGMEARIALAMRVICGVSVRDIASAMLINESTAYQRITRAKAKIKHAGIPFETPPPALWRERLNGVLATLEATYSLAYRDGGGTSDAAALGPEIERLALMLAELVADEAEALGFAALVLLTRSREKARVDGKGVMVPLSEQDVALWDRVKIERASKLIEHANAHHALGPCQVLAAIHLTHAMRAQNGTTDWQAIARLYEALGTMRPGPIVTINHAIALGRANTPEMGLELLNALNANELADFAPFQVALGDLLERAGKPIDAKAAFKRALDLEQNEAEALYLEGRIAALV